jgi:hypothetical protein
MRPLVQNPSTLPKKRKEGRKEERRKERRKERTTERERESRLKCPAPLFTS